MKRLPVFTQSERAAEAEKQRARNRLGAQRRALWSQAQAVRPRWRVILDEVSRDTGVSVDAIQSRSRKGRVFAARRAAAYALRCRTEMSLYQIGKVLRRDHATVLSAIRRHCELTGAPVPAERPRVVMPGRPKRPSADDRRQALHEALEARRRMSRVEIAELLGVAPDRVRWWVKRFNEMGERPCIILPSWQRGTYHLAGFVVPSVSDLSAIKENERVRT